MIIDHIKIFVREGSKILIMPNMTETRCLIEEGVCRLYL